MAGLFRLETPVFTESYSGTTLTAASDAATTLTADQTIQGIVTMTPGAARNLTTATAALIVAAIPEPRVGTTFELTVVNLAGATHAITLVGGDSVTVVGAAAVAHATSATFKGRVTNVTTPAVSFYRS